MSYQTFAEFFAVAVTFAALLANAFTALPIAVFAAFSFNAFAELMTIAVALMALTANVFAPLSFPVAVLDFRDAAMSGRGGSGYLERGRWGRSQCEYRQGKSETKTY